MLTKSQIADELNQRGLGGKTQIRNILDGMAELAAEEVAAGNDFTVPGVCRLRWRYRKPQKKGERYKKGAEVVGFGGVTRVADTDSPVVTAKVRLTAQPVGGARVAPRTDGQSAFLRTRAGKAIAARLG